MSRFTSRSSQTTASRSRIAISKSTNRCTRLASTKRTHAVTCRPGALLRRLRADPRNGIETVMTGAEARAAGGFPDAAFVVGGRAYAEGTARVQPAAYGASSTLHGEHGYLPDNPDMDASFFVAGPGIAPGSDLGRIDMRDVAPPLASLLHVSLPAAEGRDLLEHSASGQPRSLRLARF